MKNTTEFILAEIKAVEVNGEMVNHVGYLLNYNQETELFIFDGPEPLSMTYDQLIAVVGHPHEGNVEIEGDIIRAEFKCTDKQWNELSGIVIPAFEDEFIGTMSSLYEEDNTVTHFDEWLSVEPEFDVAQTAMDQGLLPRTSEYQLWESVMVDITPGEGKPTYVYGVVVKITPGWGGWMYRVFVYHPDVTMIATHAPHMQAWAPVTFDKLFPETLRTHAVFASAYTEADKWNTLVRNFDWCPLEGGWRHKSLRPDDNEELPF